MQCTNTCPTGGSLRATHPTTEVLNLTPRHYAYLKYPKDVIQNAPFCIIPTMRGKLQSYPLAQVSN